jgi:hypothetical protein
MKSEAVVILYGICFVMYKTNRERIMMGQVRACQQEARAAWQE